VNDRMRRAMPVERAVSALGLAEMAEATGLPARTIQNDTSGKTSPTLERLDAYVRALDEAGKGAAADELLDAILDRHGRESIPTAQVVPETTPALAAIEVAAKVGEVEAWAGGALADGVVDHVEAGPGDRALRNARRAIDRLGAIVRGALLLTPQRSLEGVR
jgi:transcriptional regulator with XRE-family HTH domain